MSEGDSEVRITVDTVGRLERKVKVLLSTKDGSARGETKLFTFRNHCYVWITIFTESADYTAYSEILEFGPGVSVVEIGIPILADSTYEELESFTVELKQPLNQTGVKIESSRSMARVDIIDDDSEINLL